MLTSGEQVDILWGSNSLFVKAYVNRQLCDLEPLLKENGKDIIDAVGWKYINCCRIGGTLYGLPNNRDFAAGWDSYALRKDILNKYNIKASDIKNIKDLEKVFDLVLEKENGVVPLACTGSLFGNFSLADGINSLVSGGHENYGQEDEVVDIFETEEYMDALKRIRKWYLKGYLRKDIFGETEPALKRVKQGKVFAYTTKGKPGIESQDKTGEDNEMVCVKLGKASISYNSISGHPYVITKNTISPELAMKVLNLFYTDADIMNLLSYGVEGVHYKKLDNGFITYVGKEKKNPFLNNAWNMPNQFITYVWEGNDKNLWENLKKFNEESIQSCELGFNFDFSEVVK